ncbi:MAG: hypothetical protein ABGY95_06290 [Rubritalea sp.]|uniref:hypothetical protein n=1 Tax=Rubritalea sp. TaxID=2109375 RepID=UPI003242AD2D
MKFIILSLVAAFTTLPCTSCMQQTVRDARGDIIYQEPVIGTPWQSERTTQEQVEQRETELGIR